MRPPSTLSLQIPFFTIVRTILNTAHRMVYAYLATLALGVGADLATFSYALTVRSLLGALGPFVATAADRRGRKVGLLLGAALFTLGISVVVFWRTFAGLAVAMCLSSFGKYIFDPAMQAFLSDRIPYHRRGQLLAVTEFSWSLAFIIGIPLMGLLIEQRSWLAPFPLLAGLGLLIIAGLAWLIPGEEKPVDPPALLTNLRQIVTSPAALAGLALGLCMSGANELVNLIFGVWLNQSFGLQIAALGAASAVIGASELGGEGLVAVFVDRLGKIRAVALGLLGNCLAALALPLLGGSEVGALAGLFLFYITFEFTLVSSIPIMTELLPTSRATLMAVNISALSLGRALGDLLGPHLYGMGFWFVIAGAVLFNLLGLATLQSLRRHPALSE